MTLKDKVSEIFSYRIKNGESGWDEMAESLSKNGTFSITGSPKKFEKILIELLKRVEKLENERSVKTKNT